MNINIRLYQSNVIWFHLNDASSSLLFSNTAEPGEGLLTCGYDYEQVNGKYRFHMDIGLQTMEADSLFRVSFEFSFKRGTWDDIFNTDFIQTMLDAALQKSLQGYREQCISHQLKPPVITFKDNITLSIVEGMIEKYFNYRKLDDIHNSYLKNTHGATFTGGSEIDVLIKGTFIILDAFFYENTNFDNKHNLKAFEQVIPLSNYLTLKLKCMEIDTKPVKLSFLNYIFLLLCIDCAIKLLLGNKADILIPIIEQSGLDEECRDILIKGGTKLFKEQQESFKKSGARVLNLEKEHDWDLLFR
jgi:hypothetical protein